MNKLHNAVTTRSEDKMMELGKIPDQSVVRISKARMPYGIRIGNYRVIYEIQDGRLIVTVITIGHRREAYE